MSHQVRTGQLSCQSVALLCLAQLYPSAYAPHVENAYRIAACPAAPKNNTPLFSAEYLAEREVNRTGKAPPTLTKMAAEARDKSVKAGANGATNGTIRDTPADTKGTNGGLQNGAVPKVLHTDLEMQPVQLASSKGTSNKGLALPFQPIAVAFKDINYFVPLSGVSTERELVNLCTPGSSEVDSCAQMTLAHTVQ